MMVQNLKDFIREVKKTEMGFIIGQMGLCIKDSLQIIKLKARGNINMKMVEFIKENLKII